jgi:hypothetical protein
MDTPEDIRRDKYNQWKEEQYWANSDYCKRDCDEHNESCPYYDPEQETWDFEQCFEDRGGID